MYLKYVHQYLLPTYCIIFLLNFRNLEAQTLV